MPESTPVLPVAADLLTAAARIAPHARVTPVLRCRSLDALHGCELHFKAEHLQRTGAFKFRGACNAVFALDDVAASRGVVTHSSGNHGAALALAAALRGIRCHVVVPEGAVASKLDAIRAYGATLHRCAASIAAREATCAHVQADTGARLVHPYTDPLVIAGQGTAALELCHQVQALDAVIVPIGGGGLASGTAIALATCAPHAKLFLAEPVGADDAARSLRSGTQHRNDAPNTICDGLRGDIGAIDLDILRAHAPEVLTVDDADTLAALRLLWMRSKQLVEPSSAIALAAVMAHRERFAGWRIGIVLSGGNVDLAALSPLLTQTTAASA